MQQDSRIHQMIQLLQDMIDNGQSAPLNAGKVMVSREEMSRALEELSYLIDVEMKHYRSVTDKRGKIISEAKKEAEQIIYEAEQSASRMRVKKSGSVSPIRVEELSKEDRQALSNANEIYAASVIYTDELLKELDDAVKNAYENIYKQYQVVLSDMEKKIRLIEDNRNELMHDLGELKKEDRYQQIVEISQLLSNELYYAKKNVKDKDEDSDEDPNQLVLSFDDPEEEKPEVKEEKKEEEEEVKVFKTSKEKKLEESSKEAPKDKEEIKEKETPKVKPVKVEKVEKI